MALFLFYTWSPEKVEPKAGSLCPTYRFFSSLIKKKKKVGKKKRNIILSIVLPKNMVVQYIRKWYTYMSSKEGQLQKTSYSII